MYKLLSYQGTTSLSNIRQQVTIGLKSNNSDTIVIISSYLTNLSKLPIL